MTRPLNFGVFITPFHPVGQSATLALEYDLERTVALDRLGYDEVWFGEHHSGGYELIGCPEMFIAAAAERTKHIKLGTGVVSLPYHHPWLVADRLVLLDHLTRGRVIFGAGPGALPTDAYMMGIDPVDQRRMMEESLEAILALFRAAPDERVSRQTDWFTMRDARLQMRPYTWPHPEIAVRGDGVAVGAAAGRGTGTSLLSLSMSVPGGFAALGNAWEVVDDQAAEGRPRRAGPHGLAGASATCTSPRRRDQAIEDCTLRAAGLRQLLRRGAASCRWRTTSRAPSRRASSSSEYAGRATAASARPTTPSRTSRACSSSPAASARSCCSATTGRTTGDVALLPAVRPRGHPALQGPADGAAGVARLGQGQARRAVRPRGPGDHERHPEHTDELKERRAELMRAVVLRDGQMVVRDDVPEPMPGHRPGARQVKACGICGSDLHFAKHGETMLELGKEMEGMPIAGGDCRSRPRPRHLHGPRVPAEVLEAGPDTDAPKPGTSSRRSRCCCRPTGVEPIVYSNTTIGGYGERMLLSAPLLLRCRTGSIRGTPRSPSRWRSACTR